MLRHQGGSVAKQTRIPGVAGADRWALEKRLFSRMKAAFKAKGRHVPASWLDQERASWAAIVGACKAQGRLDDPARAMRAAVDAFDRAVVRLLEELEARPDLRSPVKYLARAIADFARPTPKASSTSAPAAEPAPATLVQSSAFDEGW
jgi:hypothetical protein